MKTAPIEADDASKAKKKQSAGGGGKKSTKVDKAEHPGGDTVNDVADGIDDVAIQS